MGKKDDNVHVQPMGTPKIPSQQQTVQQGSRDQVKRAAPKGKAPKQQQVPVTPGS